GVLRRLIFYALLVLIWEAVFRAGVWPPYLFPSPLQVVDSLVSGFRDSSFPIAMLTSIKRILIGYGLSMILGITLGFVVGRVKLLDETVGSLMNALQVLPSICWLPLAILWFGLSEYSIQFVVIMGAFLSIAIATDSGIKNIPPIYIRVAKCMGISGLDMYRRVMLPAALPSIATGMKLGWSFAWRSLMAGELLFVSLGLGHLLQMGRELNDMSQVIAVLLMIAALGLCFDQLLFTPFERHLRRRWGTAG
ncbi:MAG: ABC transporter permease, partial [candidate division Zixibacteria bacterium]|nr:ABC transporter permease [candidate division Zixibacteria bacterium]